MSVFAKLKTLVQVSWLKTVYFNFYYLPLKQAIKLPVWLYSCKLAKMNGSVKLGSTRIKPGMVRLGIHGVILFPKEPLIWANKGEVRFDGKASIGSGSGIRCFPKATLVFGQNFATSLRMKIDCFNKIEFGENVLVAWEVVIMDSSQHRIKNLKGNFIGADHKPIYIGKNTWIGSRCMILQGAKLPDFSICAAMSVINKDFSSCEDYSLFATDSHVVQKKVGLWRDPCDPRDNIARDFWHIDD